MNHLTAFFAFGMPGIQELMIILVLALLLFGTRIPSVMRSMGAGITEFKKGIKEGASEPEGDSPTSELPK